MKITSNTVGTTTPRANYNQADPKKADYIIGRDNIVSKDELESATDEALRNAKASGEFDGRDGVDGKDGANGKDGVSATHYWNGTTLTITSASGTSSADLKGDKGDKGADGDPGVYTLSEGESLEDAPAGAVVVIDPDGTPDHFVTSVNGIKPDANGNINLPIYNGEVASV